MQFSTHDGCGGMGANALAEFVVEGVGLVEGSARQDNGCSLSTMFRRLLRAQGKNEQTVEAEDAGHWAVSVSSVRIFRAS